MASGIKITGMKDLERKLKNLQRHPEKLFKKGDTINITCPICSSKTEAIFIMESHVRCKRCNNTIKIDFETK